MSRVNGMRRAAAASAAAAAAAAEKSNGPSNLYHFCRPSGGRVPLASARRGLFAVLVAVYCVCRDYIGARGERSRWSDINWRVIVDGLCVVMAIVPLCPLSLLIGLRHSGGDGENLKRRQHGRRAINLSRSGAPKSALVLSVHEHVLRIRCSAGARPVELELRLNGWPGSFIILAEEWQTPHGMRPQMERRERERRESEMHILRHSRRRI